MSYAQARKDFEFLETLAILDDQVELDAERENLMRNPTKATAAMMYEAGISLWFGEHGAHYDGDPKVNRIRERYL